MEDVGGILTALRGLVTWESAESRRFCQHHRIAEGEAESFMAKLDTFVETGSMLISMCHFAQWHAVVNFVLNGTPDWEKTRILWSVEEYCRNYCTKNIVQRPICAKSTASNETVQD